MPLPDSNRIWPPPNLDPVYDQQRQWSAWWGGEPHVLASVYSGRNLPGEAPSVRNRASQYRGGVTGKMARFWWGAPIPDGERQTKLHIPLAGDIATLSADLLFASPPTFKAADKPTQTRLAELIDAGIHTRLREGADVGSALGGTLLRVVWDEEVSPRPWIAATGPDSVVPEWRWDTLSAATFWRNVAENGQQVRRHLERHERGRIVHGLYEGTATHLGQQIPLTEDPSTEPLLDMLQDGDSILTGSVDLTAAYIPNVRPNRLWRHLPDAVNLGRSDYAGLEGMLDALDEVWSSWMRDVRLAKARLFISQHLLETNGRGQGAWFDGDRELFVTTNSMPRPGDGQDITPNQFAIRVTEHADTAAELAKNIVRGAGYSVQSLGLEGENGMLTATEVDAREKRSVTTRDRKIAYWRSGLTGILRALLAVDNFRFGSKVVVQNIDIDWPKAISEDLLTTSQTATLLVGSRIASRQTAMQMVHPDWSRDEIDAELVLIDADRPVTLTRPARPDPNSPEPDLGPGLGEDEEELLDTPAT